MTTTSEFAELAKSFLNGRILSMRVLGYPRRRWERAPQKEEAGILQANFVNVCILWECTEPRSGVSSPVSATKVMESVWGWKGLLKFSRMLKS